VSHASCPSADLRSVIVTLIPDIPSGLRSYLPSEVLNVFAADTGAMPSRTVGVMSAPIVTGGAGKVGFGSRVRDEWWVNGVLGMGGMAAGLVGGLAAFL